MKPQTTKNMLLEQQEQGKDPLKDSVEPDYDEWADER